jgi:hypothetical protein
MPAPKGHPLWGNPCKPKKYSPGKLWEGSLKYFEWCDENPIMVTEQTKMPQRLDASMMKTMKPAMIKQFLKQVVELPHQRCYSIEGLSLFLDINPDTFYTYAKLETYSEICTRIKHIINTQHFEGGMAGTFNANIVTRKLGLIDKSQSDVNVNVPKIEVQDKDTEKAINDLFDK